MYIRTVHETCVAESAHSLVNNTKSMENGGALSYHRFLLVKLLLFAAILVSLESPESSATYPGWIFCIPIKYMELEQM